MKDNGGTANSGKDTSDIGYLYFAVTNVNRAPTIAGTPASVTLPMNKATNINLTVTDAEGANVKLTATSSTNALVGVSVSGTGSKRVLTVTPGARKNGSATVTLIASDGIATTTNSFSVTVSPTYSGPVLSAFANKTISEDSGTNTINFTVSDKDVDLTNVTVTVSVGTALVTGTIANGDYTNRVLKLVTVTNAVGSTKIDVVADDTHKVTTNSFLLTINPVNDKPTFTLSTNSVTVTENCGATNITGFVTGISTGPTNEASQTIKFFLTTSSTNYFSKQPAISKDGILSFTPATNRYGTAAIQVYAKDSGGTNNGGIDTSVTTNFNIVLSQKFYGPSIPAIAAKTILEDSGTTNFLFKVIDPDLDLTNVTVKVTCTNTALLTVSSNATKSGSDFQISVTPKTNENSTVSGLATITLVADDGSLKATNAFTLTVAAVNDRPTFTLTTNAFTASKLQYAYTISNLVTSVSKGAANESNQTFKVLATVDDKTLFATQPAISTNGVLTFKTGTNTGVAQITIKVQDNGGTKNGGVDTSDPATFTVTIPSNPFTSLAGTYNGLFYETNGVTADRSGFVNLTVNSAGVYTGYLLMAGASNVFKGQFDLSTSASQVSMTNLSVDVNLNLASVSNVETLSGSVTNATWKAVLSGVKSVYGTAELVPAVGDYTLVIAGFTNAATAPGGDGIAWVSVDDTGVLSMKGTLADGSAISQKVTLSKAGEWPLYVPVYNKGTNGSLLSWLTFNVTNSGSILESNVVAWNKSSGLTTPKTYTSGIALDTYADATPYYPWDGFSVSSGTVILSGGNLTTPITNTVTVGFDYIDVNPAATNGLALNLDPATGSVTGSFVDSAHSTTNSIYGIMLQQANEMRGYFIGTDQSGLFLLK